MTGFGYISRTPRSQAIKYHNITKPTRIRDKYSLVVCAREAYELLNMVQPYLRSQHRRAATSIALQDSYKNARIRKDGIIYQQDVRKVESLVSKLKLQRLRS